jgi:orotidine-5'-phosphate decarboxylase
MLPKLCVALDDPDPRCIKNIVNMLDPEFCWLKIGSVLFTAHGPKLISDLRRQGFAIFLDLKFHDIPNTVAMSVKQAAALDVAMLTVHASGGSEMLHAACDAADSARHKLDVVAVSVLTSVEAEQLKQIGVDQSPAMIAESLADLSIAAGCAGVVCSAQDLPVFRSRYPDAKLVCPGIRLSGGDPGDQKRVSTPAYAIRHGADCLVVGRAITLAPEPEEVLSELIGLCCTSSAL